VPFRIAGISDDLATQVRRTLRSPQYGHPAHQEIATGSGPCRLCLHAFATGVDQRILFTYQPFSDPGSVPAPGPVFIHAAPCERYDGAQLPEDFRSVPLFFEAYGTGGELLTRVRLCEEAPERMIERLFAATPVKYLHIRNAEVGCFMARVDRAGYDD
jgi:hypothetical protein